MTTAASRATTARGKRAVTSFSDGIRPTRMARLRAHGLGLLCLGVLTAGCTSFSARGRDGDRADPGVPPPPSLSAVVATPTARPLDEIDALRQWRDHPGARLRICFLLQESGDWQGAETELQQLVFGVPAPNGDIEALARWLRARGFEHHGEPARARSETAAALALATDPELRARLQPAPAPRPPLLASPTAASFAVLPRSTWNAAAARVRSMKPMGPIHRITVHHSGSACHGDSTSTAMAAIRSIQRYHQQDQGWGDIGYHYLIDPAGRVWIGRAIEWQGAHAGDDGKNQGNIGICLLGNFVPADQGPPPPAQLATLDRLVHQLCARYHVEVDGVMTHRELKQTDCPGPYLQAAVEKIRAGLGHDGIVAAGARN